MISNNQVQKILDAVSLDTEQYLIDNDIEVACDKGCSACCKQPLVVSFPEARLALHAYKTSVDDDVFEGWLKCLRETQLKTCDITSPEQYMMAYIECPFLLQNQCAVYEARPLCCRRMACTDRKVCERDLELGCKGLPGEANEEWAELVNGFMGPKYIAKEMDWPTEMKTSSLLIQEGLYRVIEGKDNLEKGDFSTDSYYDAIIEYLHKVESC